jgi:hypothetical protein
MPTPSRNRIAVAFYYGSIPLITIGSILLLYTIYMTIFKRDIHFMDGDNLISLGVTSSVTVVGVLTNFISRKVLHVK